MIDPRTPEGNAEARKALYMAGFAAGAAGKEEDDTEDPDFYSGWIKGDELRYAHQSALDQRFPVQGAIPHGAYYTPRSLAEMLISEEGGVKVYHGDAINVLAQLEAHSVDVFLCDPPYSSGGMFKGDRMASTGKKYVQTGQALQYRDFNGDNRDQRSYLTWSTLWLSEALRVCKPAGLIGLFTDWRQIGVTIDALQCGGFIYRGIVPWDKTQAARPRKGAPRNQCEYVVWGSNGAMADEGECFPGFHTFSVAGSEKTHIAGKPDKLMQELVKWCAPGGIICDCFCGSGTTLRAAKAMGRRALGVDINGEWAGDASNRAAGELTLFDTPQETTQQDTPELFS